MLESLENRRFLSGGVTVAQSGGVLTVTGGAGDSQIHVKEDNHNVLVESGGVAIGTFSGVTAIKINGQAKFDDIFYEGNTVGAKISAGGGNDRITITDSGTAGSYASGD